MARACLVTDASTGIGEACASRLDRAGWRVFAGVRRDEDAARLRASGSGRLVPVRIDVTDAASIASAAAAVRSSLEGEGLAGLVNNAGIALAGPLEFLPIEEFRRQLDINVVGQLAVTQAFLPLLRASRGRIVMMGSISGRMATPFVGPYAASKFALEAMTDALRVELQPWGLHVAIVEPGSIATPIWKKGTEHASRLGERFPAEATALYAQAFAALQGAVAHIAARGLPPDAVARAVEHALTSAAPKTRYLVGGDAKLRARIAAFVPDRLRDAMLTRALKLPRRDARVAG
jgi:NAD(P)-dependent dehydrogenase (short-subunit alcohol dehydrogenase family)